MMYQRESDMIVDDQLLPALVPGLARRSVEEVLSEGLPVRPVSGV